MFQININFQTKKNDWRIFITVIFFRFWRNRGTSTRWWRWWVVWATVLWRDWRALPPASRPILSEHWQSWLNSCPRHPISPTTVELYRSAKDSKFRYCNDVFGFIISPPSIAIIHYALFFLSTWEYSLSFRFRLVYFVVLNYRICNSLA